VVQTNGSISGETDVKTGFVLASLVCCCAVSIAAEREKPKYAGTLDYIQKTGRLWGVKELVLNANGTATLVHATRPGYGYGMWMLDANDKVVDQIVLSPHESCRLSDGDHAFIKYELKAVKDGVATVLVKDKFDAASFGKGVTEESKTVQVKAYKDEKAGPKQPSAGDSSPRAAAGPGTPEK
jgi:hypothetical protein